MTDPHADAPDVLASLPCRPSTIEPLLRPVHAFLAAESAGGIVLLVAAVVALAWANSPWGDGYAQLWHTKVSLAVGGVGHAMSLEHLVNDGLMVVFFLLVGLEIKREVLLGELASVKQAALPVAAAVGGMAVPALIFLTINYGRDGAAGWSVPMAPSPSACWRSSAGRCRRRSRSSCWRSPSSTTLARSWSSRCSTPAACRWRLWRSPGASSPH